MPKSKTKSRPAQPDTLRAASPAVATRTRLALVGTDTPLADREEADDQAAANATPKEADNAMAGVEPPTQPRNPDSEESEDEYSTDSSLNEDAVAADAEASRRRTSARLEELEGAQQDAPFVPAASQFAARGVRMLGRNAMPTADPFSTRSAGANLRVHLQDDSRRKLCAAGGWTAKTSTAEEYAGLTIEATRYWSKLMIRPVTLL